MASIQEQHASGTLTAFLLQVLYLESVSGGIVMRWHSGQLQAPTALSPGKQVAVSI